MRRIRHAAAVGAVVSLLSLGAAPAAAAAPRTDDSVGGPFLMLHGFVEHVAEFLGGSLRALFGAVDDMGDPDG